MTAHNGAGKAPWLPLAVTLAGVGVAAALVARRRRKQQQPQPLTTAIRGASKRSGSRRASKERVVTFLDHKNTAPLILNLADARVLAVKNYLCEAGPLLNAEAPARAVSDASTLGQFLAFKDEYKTCFHARPDVGEGQLLRVTDWYRLTPEDYDRTTFHVEVDVSNTSVEHFVNGADGKALSVYATNDPEAVSELIAAMGLNPHQVVSIADLAPQQEADAVVLTTVEKLLTQYLDIFGKPTREFLKKLAPFAHDIMEKVQIAELTLERKMEEFQDRQARALTFADYLVEFKSLKIPIEKYLELIPTIKQRVYSICSSSNYLPGKCQLLVVREDWEAKGGDTKFGLCSSFLTSVRPGNYFVGHSTHSVMKIPEDQSVPIFMAGLGTGLAPFRAFVQERKWHIRRGARSVGPMTLFFGGRYSKQEYYYREEFEAFEQEGLVKCCNAWSRDTPGKKVYVQNKIKEEEDAVWEQLLRPDARGYFFLCGSKQPEKDVFRTLLEILQSKGGMSASEAQQKMEELQAAGRYVTEVY